MRNGLGFDGCAMVEAASVIYPFGLRVFLYEVDASGFQSRILSLTDRESYIRGALSTDRNGKAFSLTRTVLSVLPGMIIFCL